jgi:hypothetical protein
MMYTIIRALKIVLFSPEDENRPMFQNVVFSSYLEKRTMDKFHKPNDSECYSPSSEPFRLFLVNAVYSHMSCFPILILIIFCMFSDNHSLCTLPFPMQGIFRMHGGLLSF